MIGCRTVNLVRAAGSALVDVTFLNHSQSNAPDRIVTGRFFGLATAVHDLEAPLYDPAMEATCTVRIRTNTRTPIIV